MAVFALPGLTRRARPERRAIVFLAALTVVSLWLSSAEPFAWLTRVTQQSPVAPAARLFASIRYPSMMAGLAVPGVLGLAAITLHRLLRAPWPRLRLSLSILGHDDSGRPPARL